MVNLMVVVVFMSLVCFASSQLSSLNGGGYYINGNNGNYGNPCVDYQTLNGKRRGAGSKTLSTISDNNKNWRLAWYRFISNAGDKMADIDTTEECLVSPSCGAQYPGFLKSSHPEDLEPGEEVQRTVCFAKKGNCCFKTKTILIRKCQGFWIYKLPRPSLNGATYCGNKVFETKPKCDEKKLLYGLTKKNAAKSCNEIKNRNNKSESGVYWINPDGNNPTQAYCDQETDGGGWTLVYSYTFTNFKYFASTFNAITPRPNWSTIGDVPMSTTAPVTETDYNAMDFNLWKKLGHEFMVKSNINHWIACKELTGSLVETKAGTLQCRNIKNVASKCHGFVPDELIYPNGQSTDPDLIRSQSGTKLKEYYFFDGNTRSNWPTHDPCGTNSKNHLIDVANPHGNIYIRA